MWAYLHTYMDAKVNWIGSALIVLPISWGHASKKSKAINHCNQGPVTIEGSNSTKQTLEHTDAHQQAHTSMVIESRGVIWFCVFYANCFASLFWMVSGLLIATPRYGSFGLSWPCLIIFKTQSSRLTSDLKTLNIDRKSPTMNKTEKWFSKLLLHERQNWSADDKSSGSSGKGCWSFRCRISSIIRSFWLCLCFLPRLCSQSIQQCFGSSLAQSANQGCWNQAFWGWW